MSVHRHVNCATPLPVTPTIFTSVAAPHVKGWPRPRRAAGTGSSPRVATSEPTNANPRSGPRYQRIHTWMDLSPTSQVVASDAISRPDDAEALAPWSPAEGQPPRGNRRAADEPAEDADEELG